MTRTSFAAGAAPLIAVVSSPSSRCSRPAAETGSAHAGGTGAADQKACLAAVNKVCAHAVAAHAGHPFPVPGFDPEHPDPSQLPAVANYFAHYGGLPQTTDAPHHMTPPAADATAWRELLNTADQMTANAQRQIAAARARIVTTFVQTVHSANRLSASASRPNPPPAAKYSDDPGAAPPGRGVSLQQKSYGTGVPVERADCRVRFSSPRDDRSNC